MYSITILVPKTLNFEPEFKKCPVCKETMEKHIHCDGARFHVLSWSNLGKHCSCTACEVNHQRKHSKDLGV